LTGNEAANPSVHGRSVHRCGLVGCAQMPGEISDAWGDITNARLGCYPNRRRVSREGASRTPHLLSRLLCDDVREPGLARGLQSLFLPLLLTTLAQKIGALSNVPS